MRYQGLVRLYRAFFAALALAAIGYQLSLGLQREHWSPVNFFSFFTIQSNIIAMVVLAIGALSAHERQSARWSVVRGGATMYMITTGIVYAMLLSGLEESLQTATPWVNSVLHHVIPVVMVVDLVIRPLSPRVTGHQALTWMIYPSIWLVYTLLRGPLVDWYPYPFVNPDQTGGYLAVAAYCVAILVGFAALSWLIVRLNRVLSRLPASAAPAT